MSERGKRAGGGARVEERTIEAALARLEEIVGILEGGEVELAAALTLCREGRELHDYCIRQIEAFEGQLAVLAADGTLEIEAGSGSDGAPPAAPGGGA
jgi:exodeoxyribonuclease VII small subunit